MSRKKRIAKRRSTVRPPSRLKARGAADILAVVPYLLGFHPWDSLVIVVVRDRKVELCARVDLPPPDLVDVMGQQVAEIAAQQTADGVVLIAYTSDGELASQVLLAAVIHLEPIEVLDALHADGSRWRSYLCNEPSCCPPEGVAYDLDSSPLAAEAVFAGLRAAPNRREIEAVVAGPAAHELDALIEAADSIAETISSWDRTQSAAEMQSRIAAYLAEPRILDPTDCLWLAVLAVDLHVRDLAWSMIGRDQADDHDQLWRQVVRWTPEPYELAPLCLLGIAAWVNGNGALQVCCIERAIELNPRYTMINIVSDINTRALPPQLWEEWRQEIFDEVMAGA